LTLGLQFKDSSLILHSMANTYRIMKNMPFLPRENTSSKIYLSKEFVEVLEKTKSKIKQYDLFGAYILLYQIEKKMALLNDEELVIYQSFKLKLESFFQSCKYKFDKDSITFTINNMISFLDYAIGYRKLNKNKLIRNFC
jgi:hypothetical protein